MMNNSRLSCDIFELQIAVRADDPLNSKMLMVLEYTEGGSLFSGSKINPNRRLTELSARKYFRDVLSVSLHAVHALII